jgi:hypothetical protein
VRRIVSFTISLYRTHLLHYRRSSFYLQFLLFLSLKMLLIPQGCISVIALCEITMESRKTCLVLSLMFNYSSPRYNDLIFSVPNNLEIVSLRTGARCSVVVKVLCYKPEGREFET